VGVVVLLAGAGAGELDRLGQLADIGQQMVVDEFVAVVGVDAPQRERQARAHRPERLQNAVLAASPGRSQQGPAAGDVRGGQGPQIGAPGGIAPVRDGVHFEVARRRVRRPRTHPHGNLVAQVDASAASMPLARMAQLGRGQQAVDLGGADAEQLAAQLRRKRTVMALVGVEPPRQSRRHQLPARLIHQQPERFQHHGHLRPVGFLASARGLRLAPDLPSHHFDGVLARPPLHLQDLVQDPRLPFPSRPGVSPAIGFQ